MELSFPRTFAPGSESSIGGTFAPWNFCSYCPKFVFLAATRIQLIATCMCVQFYAE